MVQTLFDYLTQRNAQLVVHLSPPTYTNSDMWDPVEAIEPWEDFDLASLTRRYRQSLDADTSLTSTVEATEEAGHTVICDEAALNIVLGSTNISMVSRALPGSLFLSTGSRIMQDPTVRPDWGVGDANIHYTHPRGICPALVCGDTKVGWDVERAIRVVGNGGYEDHPSTHLVRPFEQLQHYCTVYRTRYGFILTNEFLVLIRLKLSPSASKQRLFRPRRQTVAESHRRVLSDTSTGTNVSDVSETFSTMSFQPKPQDEDVGGLEVKIVPWDHGSSRETININLYFLARLASESRELSHHYDPLNIDVEVPGKEKRKRQDDSTEQSSGQGSRKP
ncbi:hypothetical protein AYO20_01620 [Fonsecaea nubica]|uniref:Uncharacterized protein n=1 Tax=Fonsecaea nubica TaxID=856822 RepID=A0A178D9N8_9EURO|nr:hypothetical protein AYO20_01620 [Fonsecaea nubica]OAL38869.1 hypothetical protein AYO20_01620 [Fonsecaea nubica]